MTHRDFSYWLSGFIEIRSAYNPPDLSEWMSIEQKLRETIEEESKHIAIKGESLTWPPYTPTTITMPLHNNLPMWNGIGNLPIGT